MNARRIVVGFLAVIVLVGLVGYLLKPGTFGASHDTLEHSLRDAAGSDKTGNCFGPADGGEDSEGSVTFPCKVIDTESEDPTVPYMVYLDDSGCWEARRSSKAAKTDLPATLDGCISIGDVIRLNP